MPVYVYECQSCTQQWEYMQSMSDPPKTTCEQCGGKLEKIIAPTAFLLKGSGWYKDLYSSAPKGKSDGAADKGDAAKSEAKPEAKAETKAEAKSETKAPETKAPAKKE